MIFIAGENRIFVEKHPSDSRELAENQLPSNAADMENPLEPPGANSKKQVWPELNAVEASDIFLSAKKFRDHSLLEHLKDCRVYGNFEWVHSLLENSVRTGIRGGKVRTDSNRSEDSGFMKGSTGCYAVLESLKAGRVEPDAGCLIVAEDTDVDLANEYANFLVGTDYSITLKDSTARRAQNISEFRGDWDSLREYLDAGNSNGLSHRELCVIGATGLSDQVYSSVNQIKEELEERRKRRERNGKYGGEKIETVYDTIPLLDRLSGYEDLPYVIDPKQDSYRQEKGLEYKFKKPELDLTYGKTAVALNVPYQVVQLVFHEADTAEEIKFCHERAPEIDIEFSGNRYTGEYLAGIKQIQDLKSQAYRKAGTMDFHRDELEPVLKSYEDVMNTRARLVDKTMEQDFRTGDAETHLEQVNRLLKDELEPGSNFEIDDRSYTRCNLCSRYVETAAKYFRTVKSIEEAASKRDLPGEDLDKGFDISYSFGA